MIDAQRLINDYSRWLVLLAVTAVGAGVFLGMADTTAAIVLFSFMAFLVLFSIVWNNPRTGLYLAIVMLMFDSQSIPGPISISASNVLLIITFIALVGRWLTSRRDPTRLKVGRVDTLTIILGCSLLFAAALSLYVAKYNDPVLRQSITIVGGLTVVFLTHVLSTDGSDVYRLAYAYIWGAMICAVLGILQSILAAFSDVTLGVVYPFVGSTTLTLPRVASTWLDPNVYGLYLLPAFPLALLLITRGWVKWPMLAVLAFGLFVSYSRTSWLGAALSVIVVFTFLISRSAGRRLPLKTVILRWMILLAGYAAAILIAVRLGLWERLLDLNRDSFDNRFVQSLLGLQYYLNSPLVGIGPGNLLVESGVFTHNSYLSVLIGYGLIGALAWFALLITTGWRGLVFVFKCNQPCLWRVGLAAMGAFSGLLVGGLAIEIENDKFTWFVIALMPLLAQRFLRGSEMRLSENETGERAG